MADRVETIGIYSAYGFAKEAGYTGTKAEFEQGLKNSAEYATNAAASATAATNAKNAAVTAKTDAQAAQSAAETAQGLAEDAQAAAETAQSAAEGAAASLDASTIARIDGNYDSMTVGSAGQLISSQYVEDKVPYKFRTSGGSADIGDREYNKIIGGSIVWNQLVQNGDFSDGTTGWSAAVGRNVSISASDGICECEIINFEETANLYNHLISTAVPLASGKVYLFAHELYSPKSATAVKRDIANAYYSTINDLQIGWNNIQTIYKPTISNPGNKPISFGLAFCTDEEFDVGDVYKIKNVQLFDLTAMFGSDIADYIYSLEQATEGAGVAWFRKLFPDSYYEYNAGDLISVEGLQSHDTVGLNQWDEEWEVGQYSTITGAKGTAAGVRCKNPIPIVGGMDYYFYCASRTGTNNFGACWYDSNGDFITSNVFSSIVTAPSNAKYLCFYAPGSWYGTTYKGDICINLSWSGWRNGDYEPYEKHSYPLDNSLTLRGIPKLDSNNELYFDGDEYASDGTVTRKYGIVDLGTLTWLKGNRNLDDDGWVYRASLAGGVVSLSVGLCKSFDSYKRQNAEWNTLRNGEVLFSSGWCITSFNYESAQDVATAMSGIYLIYKLAEPTTEQAEPYTNPQIVNDFGTEEYVSGTIVPVGHETKYLANLRDKLQHLPDLADDEGYYMIHQVNKKMNLVPFRIPQAPAEDGEYILKATVSSGTPTYTWEAVVEAEGGEG